MFVFYFVLFILMIIQESRKSRPVDKNSAVFLTETKAETPGINSNIHKIPIDYLLSDTNVVDKSIYFVCYKSS